MASNLTIQEKLLSAALIRDVLAYYRQPFVLYTFSLHGTSRFPIILANRCRLVLGSLGLSDEMIENAQISREVWDRMSDAAREEFYENIYEIICNPMQKGLTKEEQYMAFEMNQKFQELLSEGLHLETHIFFNLELKALRAKKK